MPPRLKSLELHGYKTFASRTEFQYPGMITAIVGPNGSGKSNIADAMRWVLGEQSYSLLRGRKTEDMIFAGSEQRSRAGMASATITFDNEDNWLPIDFSEVSITRRAYRDGNNEYLLNGQRVRLREISELLAQSGLAERTYTVIGQGLVDAALALKPEERRRLFEEAAGIGLYRSRREDALNRLETTRRNLERVQDILVELEPRLRSLERQAKRVQEYERLRSDLQALLREWYGFHWHKAQKEFLHAREVLQAQQARLEQASNRYEEVNREVIAFRTKIGEIRECLNDWHSQSANIHHTKEQINRETAVIEERLRSIQEQKQSRSSDVAHLEEELRTIKERTTEVVKDKERLTTELEESQKALAESSMALNQRRDARALVEKKLSETRAQLMERETRLVKIKARQDELINRLENQSSSVVNNKRNIQITETDRKNADEVVEKAIAERKMAEDRRKLLDQDLVNSHQASLRLDEERKSLQEKQLHQETQRTKIQVQLDAINQAEKSLAGMSEGARAILQAARQGKVKERFTALNAILDIPKEYEQAISAALGEYVDLLFVDKGSNLENAIELLETNQNGRAALLPLDWVDDAVVYTQHQNDETLGNAAEMVKAPEAMRQGLNALLGKTVIVRDRKVARRLLSELDGFTQVVTLKGEIFHRSGTVIIGEERRKNNLNRPRQRRELEENIQQINKIIESMTSEIKQVNSTLDQARNTEADLEKKAREAAHTHDRAIDAARNAQNKLEQIQNQLDWQIKQAITLENQLIQTRKEIDTGVKEIGSIGNSLEEIKENVRNLNTSLNNLPLEEFLDQVNHWHTQTAVIRRALSDSQSRESEITQGFDNNTKRLAELSTLLQNFDLQQAQLTTRQSTLAEQESNLDFQLAALQNKIEPAEQEIHRAEKEYNRLMEVETASQQALTVAERYQAQAQGELSRHREQVENLRQRIEEDFGLVSLEYEENISGPAPLPLEGMVEKLPTIPEIPTDLEANIARLKAQMRRLGPINTEAQAEYHEVHERYRFMSGQVTDLHKADADLRQIIAELDDLMRREFRKTYEAVAEEFKGMFTRLFSGGNARLILVEGDTPAETGIEIETRLPGRREQGLSLLSGGERSLTAVALVFSLLKISPTPFCIMDEVDAMLDEANVGRFRDLLRELSQTTQFIVITHNRNTVQAADVIYGVTMGRDSASQVISLKMDEVSADLAE